jgi:hypothetical protein
MSARGPLLLGMLALASLIVGLAATHAAPTLEHTPVRPHGPWKSVFVTAFIVCFAAYVMGVWLLRRRTFRLAPVLLLAFAIQLTPLFAPLLVSTDVYGYWEYGWIGAVADANPYEDKPREFLDNPAHALRGDAWTDYTVYYGPLFVAASEGIALLADERWEVVWTYKSVSALAMIGVVGLTAWLARRRAYAAAFVGWNPLLALHFAGGGHNDAWMMALFLGALALWRRGSRDFAAAIWVAAVAIKWVPLMWLPLDVAANRRRLPRLPLVGIATGVAFVGAIGTWRFGASWMGALLPVGQQIDLVSSTSVPFLAGELADAPQLWVRRGFFVLFVLAYGWLAIQAWHGRSRRGLAAALLLLTAAWLGPWYVVWCVPLAVIEDDGLAQVLALTLTAFLLRDVLPIPYVV